MKRRDHVVAAAGTVVFLALAVGFFVAVRDASGPGHVRTVLAKAIDATENPCESVTDTDSSPGAFNEMPVGFARLAVERAAIVCNDVGPGTYYFRFTDHGALETALRRYPSVLSQELCALNHEVFTGDAMDFALPPPGPFRSTCNGLGGHVLPGAAKRGPPASRRAGYPCRLTVTAPSPGRVNLRPGLLARGTVRCNRRVRASVNIMIEGQGSPGGGEEIGLDEFRPGRIYRQRPMIVPCGNDVGPTGVTVYSWIYLTTTFSVAEPSPSSIRSGSALAAQAFSRRVKLAC